MILLLVVVVIMFAYYAKSESTTPKVGLLLRQLTKKRPKADTETPPTGGTDEGAAMLPSSSGDIDHSMEMTKSVPAAWSPASMAQPEPEPQPAPTFR